MTEYTPEQMQMFETTTTMAWITFWLIITGAIFLFIITIANQIAKDKYIRTLNEHDKAVIRTYQSQDITKLKKQKNENTTTKQDK